MDNTYKLTELLKGSLSTIQEPVLFKNMLQKSDGSHEWKLLDWDLHDFTNIFGDTKLSFRVGDHNKVTCAFQHSQSSATPPREPVLLTFQEFVDEAQKRNEDKNTWFYCDYKHMLQFFTDKVELIESFNWLKFGVDESIGKNGLYSTIWIGSKGAHTDCHWDTYGYNLIAQVYGRKLWLLYPPNDVLIPVRIPYEESTIYSKVNFYCLTEEEFHLLESTPHKPKLIILEPGEVLFVPNGWWHYVESLDDISISVNIWGELKTDDRTRVKEALVQLLVAKIANINIQDDNIGADDYYYAKRIESAVIEFKKKEDQEKKNNEPTPAEHKDRRKIFKSVACTAKDLTEMCPEHVQLVKDAERDEFKEFLRIRRQREENIREENQMKKEDNVPPFNLFLEDVINSLCHPDVITKAAEKLLEKFSQ